MKVCTKCVLPETVPGIKFDEDGVCNFCNDSKFIEKVSINREFSCEDELIECIKKYKNTDRKYDVLVPVSGGADSSNVLITLVQKYNLRALAFHNDHGYEDNVATDNVRKLCKSLGVDLVLMQHDYDFMKKLWKYINESNVKGLNSCYVCGNILYLNAIETANKFNIPLVINGYSKGQALQVNDEKQGHELLEKLIDIVIETGDKEFSNQFMDKYKMLGKRVAFKQKEDIQLYADSDKILFIPFYVFDFYKIDKEALKTKIRETFDWRQMKISYPGRTTNCEMIWLNTYMDLKKMGYCNYHIEYAELVRQGEISRDQALIDLEFNPPEGLVERLADEIKIDINMFNKNKQEQSVQKKNMEVEFDF
ncbi:hypothetical protein LGL55_10015 [Clostridium tagluense]|uniref:hypothetical protein n=1 Tax=Clostridium tagluense TaxID=360422 RepID=UPI001CF0FE3F|nr:hypothetical protein [Clostridium tagluense]MCB2311585.1 hypothetical protein [Clostridium tagluense]MCB2316309.1 hypothetical protein [Clostridium tagluense]MCB2321164.1 hypothetical protein [Clostridium tagluense]MCB2326178.1 hypothetical protein [Clostridium tagluense]MCB2330901.1 hypothetical protein [Clostridium tagluense]